MADTSDLVKEEFIQNYLQYRWLDDTRGKIIDRFFILTVAVFAARLQFANHLTENWHWLLAMYLFYALISVSFARTIILFRRQQRGQGQYINCLRGVVLAKITMIPPPPEFNKVNSKLAEKYKSYMDGRKIYLTTWVELAIALIASFTPFLLVDVSIAICPGSKLFILCLIVSALLTAMLLYLLLVPWKRYNFSDQISWNKD